MDPRHVVAAVLVWVATAASALDVAEVELVGSSVSRSDGAPALFGYDPVGAPDLVFSDDTEDPIGPHEDHEDALFGRERRYQDGERVNAGRSRGGSGTARGEIEAGHSIAVTSGWADAGRDELGGFAEAHAGTLGASTGGASSSMKIEKRITILPGSSGLAPGALVTGLRWEFDGHGSLDVTGRTHPYVGTSSAGCGLSVTILRGPTGTCGADDCRTGALAVAADLLTGLSFQTANPDTAGGRTARFMRNRSWSASNNTGVYKGGGVFKSGSDGGEIGALITSEDTLVSRVEGVDTGADPLGLDAIEFEANVGETLRVEMDLDLGGGVDGSGSGQADFFDSFDGRVVDPLGRGLVFESSVAVPEPSAFALAAAAAGMLRARWRSRRAK